MSDFIPIDLQQPQPVEQRLPEPPMPPDVSVDLMEDPFLWNEIRAIIENHIATQPRSLQAHIGPSELGTDCVHCLAAKLAGWKHANQAVSWLPFIGTCVHEHFERLFRDLSEGTDQYEHRWQTELRVTVGALHGINDGYEITGSIDLYDRKAHATCDWKIVSDRTIKTVKATGPSQTYRIQASLYGIGLTRMGETVERSCVYYLPRNAVSLASAYPVEMPFDPQPGMWALQRANMLKAFMDTIRMRDGLPTLDAWINRLPRSSTHCFDCGTWVDDMITGLPEFDPPASRINVPSEWLALIPLIQPTYQPNNQ
ncbi:hypothetical protein D2E25_0269 [Bifidobacterium goeldii]|uniref:Uncharacterized protein n=1 Tax=Bifidobacterium goeldii TaxID=2306975 RepID=A0A430FM13_9BIFI|nr:hypothetical protein [Bifidobacterium goeldii]RSX53963.1 hypothetical protein D2E25_0269 [Bifidobacterium goeldii]